MAVINQILGACRPFVAMVALLFGVIAAWLAVLEILPFLAQVWRPKGDMQRYALVAGALALVAGGR